MGKKNGVLLIYIQYLTFDRWGREKGCVYDDTDPYFMLVNTFDGS